VSELPLLASIAVLELVAGPGYNGASAISIGGTLAIRGSQAHLRGRHRDGLVRPGAAHSAEKYYNAPAHVEYSLISTFAATFASTILTFFAGALLYDY
jgi:hypothetical protein